MNTQVLDFYTERGFNPIPTNPRSKIPSVKWKQYTKKRFPTESLRSTPELQIALVTGRISNAVAIDVDNKDDARRLYRLLPKTDAITETPNGAHLIFGMPDTPVRPAVGTIVKGIKCDIRAEDSLAMAYPSIHPCGKQYKRHGNWDRTKMPNFDPSWITVTPTYHRDFTVRGDRVLRARNYLKHVEPAVQGQRGDTQAFRAAAILVQMFKLSIDAAWPILLEWNERCDPPWRGRELQRLRRKLYEAERLCRD